MKPKVELAVILVILVWSVLLAFDMVIASFFTLGSHDFNGTPTRSLLTLLGVYGLLGA